MEPRPLFAELFYRDGRGPELQNVHYSARGGVLKAIEYYNPDDIYAPEYLKCILFENAQVHMFTPEEVFNYTTDEIKWVDFGMAAVLNLGKSSWLLSFNQRHLANCNHYRIMFYDEFLDIICEGIHVKAGRYDRDNP